MQVIEITRNCRFCDKKFEPIRDWQRFCSDPCRKKYWKAIHRDGSALTKKINLLEKQIEELKERKGKN